MFIVFVVWVLMIQFSIVVIVVAGRVAVAREPPGGGRAAARARWLGAGGRGRGAPDGHAASVVVGRAGPPRPVAVAGNTDEDQEGRVRKVSLVNLQGVLRSNDLNH